MVPNRATHHICDTLCDLGPFVQFKKHEEHPQRSNPWMYSRFLSCTDGTKSWKASYISI